MPPIAPALPRPPRAVPRAPRRATGRAAAGMALIAVLWIVAALALLVSGMTETVRRQVRQTSAVRDAVSAAAAGQAAIQLALQDLQANAQRPDALMRRDIDFDGVPISVELLPVTGLVSVNGAPAELLQAVLTYAGGLPPGAAAQAAPDAPASPAHSSAASARRRARASELESFLNMVEGRAKSAAI